MSDKEKMIAEMAAQFLAALIRKDGIAVNGSHAATSVMLAERIVSEATI